MKRTNENPYANHENVSMLLPWYINKTLHGAELTAVEQHLKVCLVCKRELLNQQHLSSAVNQPGSFDSAAQASFSRFKSRLRTAETEKPQITPVVMLAGSNKWPGKIKTNLKHFKLPKPALALAATVLLVVLLPQFVHFKQTFNNDYRTLSDAETVNTNPNELRIIFKPDTTRQTIEQILTPLQAHVIAGPNEQSLYRIGFNKADKASQVIDKLALLRKSEHVVFAEPAYGLLSNIQPEQARK